MNNKRTATMIVAMMTIVISLGIEILIPTQNASALTNYEKFNKGFVDAVDSHQNGTQIGAQLATLGTPAFQKHSDAYRNGYIGGLDNNYGLKLPYMNYGIGSNVKNGVEGPSYLEFVPYYQSTAPNQ